jgi:hypothetical protein
MGLRDVQALAKRRGADFDKIVRLPAESPRDNQETGVGSNAPVKLWDGFVLPGTGNRSWGVGVPKPQLYADVYESPSFVKKERIIRASVNLPFVYPSIGVSLAPVGCFEVALAAPSVNEPKAQ